MGVEKKSFIWRYFEPVDRASAKCSLCNATIKHGDCSSSNLNRHLIFKHRNLNIPEVQKIRKSKTFQRNEDPLRQAVQSIIDPSSDTESNNINKSHKKYSYVWKYFIELSSVAGQCTLCGTIIKHGKHNSTNLNRHLKAKHKSINREPMFSKQVGIKSEEEGRQDGEDCHNNTTISIPDELDSDEILSSFKIMQIPITSDSNNTLEQTSFELTPSNTEISSGKEEVKKHRSFIWNHFVRVNATQSKCVICGLFLKHHETSSSNLTRHLKAKHPRSLKQVETFVDKAIKRKLYRSSLMKNNPIQSATITIPNDLNGEQTDSYRIIQVPLQPNYNEENISLEMEVTDNIDSDASSSDELPLVSKKNIGIEDSCEEHVPMWSRVGFIGAGNMAQAVATSLLRTGLCIPAQIIASAPTDRFKHHWPSPMDFTNNNAEVVHEAEYLFLGMKPHYLDNAIKSLVDANVKLNSSKCIISMLVGVDLDTLNKKLEPLIENPNDKPSIIRIMPNTAMKYGKGVTGLCHGPKIFEEHLLMTQKILEQGGICEIIPENMMNSFGAIAGSGCAYLFLVLDAMADGAVKQGIPRDMALRIGAQLLKGAGQLVVKDMIRLDHPSQAHPAVLKDSICSPGGSSIAGIHALEKAGVRCAFIDAIEAAKKRSDELGIIAAESVKKH